VYLLINLSHFLAYFLSLVQRKQIGYFTSIEKIIQIFQEGLLFDLGISKEEYARYFTFGRLPQDGFQVLSPLNACVTSSNFNLDGVKKKTKGVKRLPVVTLICVGN